MGTITISCPEWMISDIKQNGWSASAIFQWAYDMKKKNFQEKDLHEDIREMQNNIARLQQRLIESNSKIFKLEEKENVRN